MWYNEEKLIQKRAECILAENFLKDADRLTYDDKLQRLQRRMELNKDVSTSYHISLNFDPSDKLSDTALREISRTYMKELGFERQPYLVYKHNDSGHPHLHIVTTHVQRNGDPIEMYKIGANQSEKARLYIEEKFNLMTAEKKRQTQTQTQKIDGIQKVVYGLTSTTRAISDVVQYVTENFKYSSLEELNTVLRLYNVEAYRGTEGTKLHQRRGLLYRVLDKQGHYIGVPLKASFFEFKPTLANLEKKFVQNLSLKEQQKLHLTGSVSWQLCKEKISLKEVEKNLARDRIRMCYSMDHNNKVTNLTYIDFETKCAFSSKDLGELCSVRSLQNVIDRDQVLRQQQTQAQILKRTQKHRHRHHL